MSYWISCHLYTVIYACQNLLPSANILQLYEVRDTCCEFLRSQLHPSNCLGIHTFADLHMCVELCEYTQIYIEQHFRSVLVVVVVAFSSAGYGLAELVI